MSPNRSRCAVWLAGILGGVVLSGLLILVGVNASQVNAGFGPAPARLVTNRILLWPRPFLNRVVSADGEIAHVWSPRAFTLRSQPFRQGLLVVLSGQAAATVGPLREGQSVAVVGSVGLLTRQKAQELGSDLVPGLTRHGLPATYAGHPYIVASEVRAQP